MRRLLGLLFAALIWVNAVEAQELNCTVEVNSQQIEGTNKNVFGRFAGRDLNLYERNKIQ